MVMCAAQGKSLNDGREPGNQSGLAQHQLNSASYTLTE